MANVKAGTDVWVGFVDQQWDVLPNNDFSNIGMHVNNGCFIPQTPLTAIPTISADTICEGETIQFTNASTGGSSPYSVAWNFGNGNTSTNNSDSFTYSTIGVYQISLNVTDNLGATDDTIFYVVVNALPSSGLTVPNVACTGKSIVISASNYNAAYTYVYSDGVSTLNHNNGVVTYSNNNVGTYTISQTVTNVNGCSSVATETIVVNESPVASFTYSGGPSVNFLDASTNAVAWNWSFGDGNTSSTQNPSHTYAGNGSFNTSLIVVAANGCSDTVTNTVSVGVPSAVNETSTVKMSLFPNPIKGGALTVVTKDEIKEITVLNVLGQNIVSIVGDVKVINISNLVIGTYFVKVRTSRGTLVQKLIKE
jgi:PKD repeat protein